MEITHYGIVGLFLARNSYFTFSGADKGNPFSTGDYLCHVPIGDVLVELANIQMDDIIKSISKSFESLKDGSTITDVEVGELFSIAVYKDLQKILSQPLAQLICLHIIKGFYEPDVESDETGTVMDFADIIGNLFSEISESLTLAKDLIENRLSDNEIRDIKQHIGVNLATESEFFKGIDYVYHIYDLNSFIIFDYVHTKKQSITIKTCQNCGKYFIPLKRVDEIYSDSMCENGKTCKQIGYENKLKKDVFKTAYRRAYKTQRARIKYNAHIQNYEQLHFKPWEAAAKKALEEYTAKNDIDGFEKWLKDYRDSF